MTLSIFQEHCPLKRDMTANKYLAGQLHAKICQKVQQKMMTVLQTAMIRPF